jgi:response regulator RpfG family c-di-GMP phosphodiesterase
MRAMDLYGPEVDLIVSAARVHDIGKIGTPDRVLLKEGPLSEEEWARMEEHPVLGAKLLATCDFRPAIDRAAAPTSDCART